MKKANQHRVLELLSGGELCVTPDHRVHLAGRPPRTQTANARPAVSLNHKDRSKFTAYVHQVIYLLNYGEYDENLQINHIDGDKLNNAPENLEAITPYENKMHAARMGLVARGENHCRAKIPTSELASIRARRAVGESYNDIADSYGVSRQAISNIVRGVNRKHG